MNLTQMQEDELKHRYDAARKDETTTLSFDQAQVIRYQYFNELREKGVAEETMSEEVKPEVTLPLYSLN
jgi:hypothetical protein